MQAQSLRGYFLIFVKYKNSFKQSSETNRNICYTTIEYNYIIAIYRQPEMEINRGPMCRT